MIPGNSKLLKCPFCGEEKEVLSLRSGNNCWGRHWSDLKSIYPMLPKVSPIQKCPSCCKYYFSKDAEKRMGEGFSLEEGNLTYSQLKEAAVQFGPKLSKEDMEILNTLLLWAYNDLYNREGMEISEALSEDRVYINTVLDELLEKTDVDDIKRAEFLRERGHFADAIALLDRCHPSENFLAGIVEKMKSYANDGKRIAFEINV